jgi:hypothetical protein
LTSRSFCCGCRYAKEILQKEMLPHVGIGEICEIKKTSFLGDMLLGYQLMATFQILHFFLICNSYEHMYYLQVGWMATNNKNKLPKNSLDFATTSCNCKWKFFCRSCELYICGVYPKLRKYLQLCLTTIRTFCKLLPVKEKSGANFCCHNPIKFMVDWVVKVGKLWWESRPSYNVENITNGWKA